MTEQRALRRPEGVKVTYRRMKFDFEEGFDRYWLAGSPFKSLFWTQLSTAFEPGEKFFIDSARALKGEIRSCSPRSPSSAARRGTTRRNTSSSIA
jgi:hypothetical protein